MKDYDVVLTTYTTLGREWKGKGSQAALVKNHWHRVILDEGKHCLFCFPDEFVTSKTDHSIAHCIKDTSSVTAQAALALKADCRWAVTGTPVQNGLSDMFSLFRFIQVYPYSDRSIVDKHIITPWTKGEREDAIERLKKLLQYIMLRRPTDIITLPTRMDTEILLEFDTEERAEYQRSAQATMQCLNDLLNLNATPGAHKNVVTKINALRMACNMGCQRKTNFQDPQDSPELLYRKSRVSDGAETDTETRECSEDLALFGICKACGIVISDSAPLVPEDSGDRGKQLWCSSCLLDLAEPVEESPDSDITCLENIPVQTGVGKRRWPTKIKALLEDIRNQDLGTKWSVAFHPTRHTIAST